MSWADLETALDEDPLFRVERPDGRRLLTELHRQTMLLRYIRECGRGLHAHAVPNAAKRGYKAQRKAKLEGMTAGVFDLCVTWPGGGIAWAEMKGYDGAGRPGKLSQAQVDWGNSHFRMGHHVACFFSPEQALAWLEECGAPMVGRIAA